MYITALLMVIATALLAVAFALHLVLKRAISKQHVIATLDQYPSVTVIRPIKGLDVEAELNLRAALDNGYPGHVETIFVFDDEQEPAYPIVRRVVDEHEKAGRVGEARILLCGAPPENRTGKLNAMIAGLERAAGEVVVFADSDIRPRKGDLSALVATLISNENAGSAFCPVVVTSAPESVGDAGYALLLNGIYGPSAEFAAGRRGNKMPFIMGQFMALRRDAIDAIGGLQAAEGQFVDDMYLGARVTAAGYDNVVCPRRVPIIQHGLSNREFLGIFNRWLTFGRTGLPEVAFRLPPTLQFALYWTGVFLTAACAVYASLSPDVGLAHVAAMALVPVSVLYSVTSLHQRLGGSRRSFMGALTVMTLAPPMYASIFFRNEVNWRGRVYKLDASSRLA